MTGDFFAVPFSWLCFIMSMNFPLAQASFFVLRLCRNGSAKVILFLIHASFFEKYFFFFLLALFPSLNAPCSALLTPYVLPMLSMNFPSQWGGKSNKEFIPRKQIEQ